MKVASCFASILALGVTSAGGAVQAVKVPGGFRVETYVRGLEKPTAMAWGPRGVLYLTQEGGEVVSIDPRTRRSRVVLRGFKTPLGLAWLRGNLFVSARGTLWRVSSGQRKAILRKPAVRPPPAGQRHRPARSPVSRQRLDVRRLH